MTEQVATSPTSPVAKKPKVGKPVVMDFFAALRKATAGERITKVEWADPNIFGVIKDGRLVIRGGVMGDDKFHPWIITDGDLVGEDWKVL